MRGKAVSQDTSLSRRRETLMGASLEVRGLSELFRTRLPLNRKEVYFTATVLPAIICAERFNHFHRFLKLLGLPEMTVEADPTASNFQFFTEYSLAEAIDPRFANNAGKRERPDVLILVEGQRPTLIAIEAKMYDATQRSALIAQMERQEQEVLCPLRAQWPEMTTVHAALLPATMKEKFRTLDNCTFPHPDQGRPIITWEEIGDNFRDVTSAAYFVGVLDIALREYANKAAKEQTRGQYADGELRGHEIVARYRRGDREFQMMGRQGGIDRLKLRQDIT